MKINGQIASSAPVSTSRIKVLGGSKQYMGSTADLLKSNQLEATLLVKMIRLYSRTHRCTTDIQNRWRILNDD
jgi:hypothetical protein